MSKFLIISDIHIYDYPQRNPSNRYRLYQSRIIARNVIEAAQNEGCDRLIIAGDVIEKFDAKPYVLAETKLFLDTLMSFFKEGYIIWGNHDMDNKSVDSDFIDSSLSVMLPKNLYYADKREITVDGCRIGFSNYRSQFDLSWINGKLDLLITHATISYSANDHVHPQQLDESKFDLAICGDIHRPANSGKFVSIGIPQKCKMGDFDNATGVVFDSASRQYKWVDLNPHDNLMKFVYTDDRQQEGWNQSTGIWSVYKPVNISVNSGTSTISIPAWTEIDNLVSGIIDASGLQDLHNKVLTDIKGKDLNEVDFNFVLKRLRCKNWRSIDDVELYFDEGDKYLISGSNGSGKSSLLSALKYAFIEAPHYKDFIQFGTKECETEVEFIYQNHNCRILRGSKTYGCWINGEARKYNNKNEFVQDMHDRFPFIDYLEDVCFFNSDHPNFIGGLKPERKSEIISKFYKIDKIDEYNKQAILIFENLKAGTTQWQQEIDKNEKLLSYITEKLGVMTIPPASLDDLTRKKMIGLDMQRQYVEYNKFLTKTASYQSSIQASETRLKELLDKAKSLRDPITVQEELDQTKRRVDVLNRIYQGLRDITKEGQDLCNIYRDLGKTKVCKSCGQTIAPGEDLEKHKEELVARINEKSQEREGLFSQLESELGIGRDIVNLDNFQEILGNYNKETVSLMSEIRLAEDTVKSIEREKENIKRTEEEMSKLGPTPNKIELPDGFMEEMGRIESYIQTWNTYNNYISDQERANEAIGRCKAELQKIRQAQAELVEYIKLTGPTGRIYEEIMTRLADQFTDNRIHYKVERWVFRKVEHLELVSYFDNNGNEVSYAACSDGQRTALDIDILGKIVTRTGLMVMDEYLKYLDGDNLDAGIESLKLMNVGCLFLSSHATGIPHFYNRSLTTKLNESCSTVITVI